MTRRATVLVIDDEPSVAAVVGALLDQAGFAVLTETRPLRALARLASERVDVVLTDLRMPELDGLGLLERVRRDHPDVPVVMMSAHATVTSAIDALRAGAADFVLKPIDRDELIFSVGKAAARAPGASAVPAGSEMVGEAAVMRELRSLIAKAARSSATVLVCGETGTGKELVAQAVHAQSARRDRPLVTIHCGALPDALLESELFGYERGAFTGAVQAKPGRAELADGGTLFLDEIGELTLAMQVKLLRLLESRELVRLGGTRTTRLDVRFVAATHRDLAAAVRAGTFREDLYYRLAVIPIRVPSLSERREDVPALARAFVAAEGRAVVIDDGAARALAALDWPGNVRQLRNFVERLVALGDGAVIAAEDVARERARDVRLAPSGGAPSLVSPLSQDLEAVRRRAERERILEALAEARGNRSLAARLLGLSRRTFYNKLEQLGIEALLPPPSNAPR